MALTGSASDSYRKLINLEAQQLKAEVNRIVTATEFNGRKLIDGSTAEDMIFEVDNGERLVLDNDDKTAIVDSGKNKILKYTAPVGTAAGKFVLTATTALDPAGTGAAAAAAAGVTAKGDYILDSAGKAIYQVNSTKKKVQTADGSETYFTLDDATNVKTVTADSKSVLTITPTVAASGKPASTIIKGLDGKEYDLESDKPVGVTLWFSKLVLKQIKGLLLVLTALKQKIWALMKYN